MVLSFDLLNILFLLVCISLVFWIDINSFGL